jgi:tetratricopeptide (TPR) repeat protein
MEPRSGPNPFPGLRPFEPDEDHLFFGREKETDDLLRRLGSHRFLSVIGTSGCGKSSLIRSGLIPSLHSGMMARAGSSWRVAILRPGEDPIGHLAVALDAPDVLGGLEGDLASTSLVVLEATLRRGALGIVDAVRQARIPAGDNVLLLVDQFEELFRFQRNREVENSRDEAVAFVKLLLEAASQKDLPIYVVLTMRSDFIGDCMKYPGLPEAVNESQYLVPRLTRDELRLAITGPIAVADADIAPRLVLRLLNDVGDNQDELPLVQHVLMRTWDHWARRGQPGAPIDLEDYEAVGTLRNALSLHAEEAYQETRSAAGPWIAERIFKALTDTFSDPRGVRRPTSIAELAAICEVPESDVTRIVEIFRRPGRSFLMPPKTVPLGSRIIVDLSHESLMRCWARLTQWAQEERLSTALYVRLAREATWHEEGAAGLWGDPELELGLRWRRENHPTAAWARRYDDAFDRAMQFLDRSEKERDRQKAERRALRLRNLRLAWGTAAVLLVATIVVAWQGLVARRETTRAETNLQLATGAVDELLASTDRDPASVGADVPQMEQLRRDLLGRAKRFYAEFIRQQPDNEAFLREMGFAHFRLGQINRMLDAPQDAEKEYRASIAQFDSLARANPRNAEYRQALANSYNWLGESLRPSAASRGEAEKAFGTALDLQTTLAQEVPDNDLYKKDLARTHYNRGILYASVAAPNDPAFRKADADFREAIRVLEPIARKSTDIQASQELARSYNNLAALLAQGAENDQMLQGVGPLYEQAIRIHEELTASSPANREVKFELAKFSDNYAEVLRELKSFDAARRNSGRALALLGELVRPSPSLGIEQADAHNLRGRILQSEGSRGEAAGAYRQSLTTFVDVAKANDADRLSDFHLRFGDLLLNLASLRGEREGAEEAGRLLADSVRDYVAIGRRAIASGAMGAARDILDNLSRLMAALAERDRSMVAAPLRDLQNEFERRGATP